MKIAGFGVCGKEPLPRLERTLKEFKRLCDFTYIVLNNSGKEEKRLIQSYGFSTYEDNREWGLHQPKIKETLAGVIGRFNPDWVVSLDMDEVFDKNLDRTALEELTYLKGESWYFQVINMVDNGYAPHLSFPNIRFWKYDSSDLKFENRPVHCGLAPKWAYEWGNYAPYILKHYGLQKKVDRERKAKRYDRYDPAAVYKGRDYYDSLRADLTVFPFNEDMLHSKVEDEVKDLKIKERKRTKLMSEKNYYFKNKHGNIVPVPERHYEQTLKQQGMTLVSKAPVEAPKSVVEEAPVEETPTASVDTADVVDDTPETPELTCDTCGFPAKSKAGLTRHSKRHAE